jgi:hypothetical protein
MTDRPFRQIDVFTTAPGWGNPLAVVLDATGLDDAAMQRFARWTNLSETTFVLPPTEAGRAAAPTTACASSRPAVSCRLPATPRWAPAGPGWTPAGCRECRARWCRNVAWAW